ISSDGLVRKSEKSSSKLHIDPSERPVALQLFGGNPDTMHRSALIAQESAPELIDLNFGCPVRKVVEKGCGAALLRDIPLMLKITKAVVNSVKIPVTVKTRLGWDDASKNIVEIAEQLQDCGIAAITIHGRTRAQLYSGQADWSLIGEVRNNKRMHIPVIGNGDITTPQNAADAFSKYGVDAIMIGRAAIGNPWIFQTVRYYLDTGQLTADPSIQERAIVCLNHLQQAAQYKGERRAVLEMRRQYSGYFRGTPGFKQQKVQLLACNSFREVVKILAEIADQPC
ncbi:MAG TPA: tRNA dihydrouridine synthase DusB, partial [Bacteroidales bacterium]|nr:tRNA dihydrouridine synthase DusB [Bacteroidales bacterium]